MLTRMELEQLATYHSPDFLVTSLYLNLDKGRLDEAKVQTRLKNVLADVEEQRPGWNRAQIESVERDLERIRGFVRDQHVRGGQGVVIFSCSGSGLWQAYTFPHRVGNHVHFGPEPYTKPLFRWLSQFEPICSVLVGKEKARIFMLRGDEVGDRGEIVSDVPKKHEQGGWAQARLQRKHEEAVGHHFKSAADRVFELYQQEGFGKLVLAGPGEVVKDFQAYLHPYVRERLVGTMPLSMVASAKTVRDRTQAIIGEINTREAGSLMDRLEEEAGSHDMGTAGLSGVLEALSKGQIQTLLVHEGYAQRGKQCTQCRQLTVTEDLTCPDCGGPLRDREDLVEQLADRAFEQGCQVVFLDGTAGNRLEKLGQIGAILRFKLSSIPA